MKTFKRILVVYSEKISSGHRQAVEGVRRRLQGRRYRMVRSQRLCGRDFDRVDLVITVGGDGAFIRAAAFVERAAILGINSEPEYSEGALTSIRDDELDRLNEFLAGRFATITRQRARAELNGQPLPSSALNEIYVGARYQFHTSRYLIEYRGVRESQRSSGVLVVTGSGSRAWYHSSGGRPFHYSERRLRFLVREPYSGRLFRPRLLHGEVGPADRIRFESQRQAGGIVVLDAWRTYPFNRGSRLEISLSEWPLTVLVPTGSPSRAGLS
ncbi:MAG TPA: hypothetical protein PKN80_02365 [bacterium]|uniref:Putative inorganic polyphosphate/ATP-NAD kinase n=1 Tax=candidate division TA06 bacterium ADurb.Bin417 TaxID=1852828 RepID=A0A1V5M916_UNCT6|nr:MAG: putative inorganic polyphosphate/ATP-NAD kinase [candidate division TA06 bacterium ADurb.Bin417]HNQ34888.1 hypothetical protein [bacterium]HNS48485.1 hypothetical protein [bacterium]